MKKIILLLSLAISTASVYAIGPKIGVKVGVLSQSINLKDKLITDNYKVDMASKIGYQMGVVSVVDLGLFQLQPEVLFNIKRYRLMLESHDGRAEYGRSSNTFCDMTLPVLLQTRLLFVRLNAGPVFTLMKDNSISNRHRTDISGRLTNASVNIALGAGIDIKQWSFDVRYNSDFNTKHRISFDDVTRNNLKTRCHNFAFSLTYFFN